MPHMFCPSACLLVRSRALAGDRGGGAGLQRLGLLDPRGVSQGGGAVGPLERASARTGWRGAEEGFQREDPRQEPFRTCYEQIDLWDCIMLPNPHLLVATQFASTLLVCRDKS